MLSVLLRSMLFAVPALCLVSGCAIRPRPAPVPPPAATPIAKVESYWKGATGKGSASIVIRLGQQRAFFYKGKELAGVSKISTGRKGFDTPTGTYKVIQKDKDHVSSLYGDYVSADGGVVKSNVDSRKDRAPSGSRFKGASMPYFLRFYAGYGLHAGRVPNWRASHGCVRLPSFMARHFFENASRGTPVKVLP